MIKCKDCKWWDPKSFAELHPEYEDDLSTFEWYPSTARYCKLDNLDEFVNVEYGDAKIITTPEFGCIFFEEKI